MKIEDNLTEDIEIIEEVKIYTKSEIFQTLDIFTKLKSITWRPFQIETILSICEAILNNTHNDIVLDAPTGTGKSIIAMACAWVIEKFNKDSYICVSDLLLQKQYEDDILNLKLDWSSIKGIDNYTCNENGLKLSLGNCKVNRIKPKTLACYANCTYFSARNRALDSSTCVLNYSYYLLQTNYTGLFKSRSVVFLDEAHNLDSIIHRHYAPRLNRPLENTLQELENMIDLPKSYRSNYSRIWLSFYTINDHTIWLECLKQVELILTNVNIYGRHWISSNSTVDENSKLSTFQINVLNKLDFVKDVHCKVEDFVDLIAIDSSLITRSLSSDEVAFNYLDTRQMMYVFFKKHTYKRVYMSATWGNLDKSLSYLNIKDPLHIKIPNEFDYSKSKYKVLGNHGLNFYLKKQNMNLAVNDVDYCLDIESEVNGIIHTNSYEFTSAVLNYSRHKDRMISYTDSATKKLAIEKLKTTTNSILVGPSIMEGVNLPDDMCRFIICFKTPYMSLSDNFIKRKAQKNQSWYYYKTALLVEQSVGRGMRHKDDWCNVYFIDKSFKSLFKKKHLFSTEFLSRL